MKKIFIITFVLMLVFCFTACSSSDENVQTSVEPVQEEVDTIVYDYNLTDSENCIEGITFEKDVTITGENGKIFFENCEFKGNIINKTGEGGKVFLMESCVVSENTEAILDSTLTEATQDTDLPKFMIFCPGINVTCGACGAVVSLAELPISVNGNSYDISDAMYYVNSATGEFDEYSGQEADMQNVAMWKENGSDIFMHCAVKSE